MYFEVWLIEQKSYFQHAMCFAPSYSALSSLEHSRIFATYIERASHDEDSYIPGI